MKYSKISATFVNFPKSLHASSESADASLESAPAQSEIIIKTYESDKITETHVLFNRSKNKQLGSFSKDLLQISHS